MGSGTVCGDICWNEGKPRCPSVCLTFLAVCVIMYYLSNPDILHVMSQKSCIAVNIVDMAVDTYHWKLCLLCLLVFREQEFSYKDGAFQFTSKPCKMRDSHRPKFDVLLTSYEFVSQDGVTLSSIDWEVLIIDEAHRLKNNQSLV